MKHQITPAAIAALAEGDLSNFLVASTPGGIERQEAEGQAALCSNQQTLPIKAQWPQLELLGFKRGENIDDIFVSVQFPPGWSLKPTSHSMHNDLLDSKGRKRGGVFYKAAFYDRKADCHLNSFYSINLQPLDADGNATEDWGIATQQRWIVRNGNGALLFESALFKRGDYDDYDKQRAAARSWLDAHLPENNDPLAYWD